MKYDVAVIGASSAGLHAATQLARGGCKVAVFEQKPEIKPARRILIITDQIYKFLPDLPDHLIRNKITRMELTGPVITTDVEFKMPDLVVERSEFMSWQIDQARNAGVEIFFRHRLKSLIKESDHVRFDFQSNGQEHMHAQANAVIGADGVFSKIAKLVHNRRHFAVPIVQALVRLPVDWDPSVAQVYFEMEDTNYFYWMVPESETHGVVGLIGNSRQEIRILLDRYLEMQGLKAEAYEGGMVAMYRPGIPPSTKLGSTPIMLVGDAAGHVKVTTVGGLVSGIWGAEMAAKALLENKSYSRMLMGLTGELYLHWLLRGLVNRRSNRFYHGLLRRMNGPLKLYLHENNRDSFNASFWKLLQKR